jgi:hypothetical protein
MGISLKTRDMLETHLQEKWDNHQWLDSCLHEKIEDADGNEIEGNTDSFPYCPVENGKARFDKSFYMPRNPPTLLPEVPQEGPIGTETAPLYLVNIPMRHLPGARGYTSFQRLLQLLKDEAFGTTPNQSRQEIQQRFALVLGINQIKSIDPSLNRAFTEYIGALPRINDLAYRVIGFFWKPQWMKKEGIEYVYPLKKAFMLVKSFSPKIARMVRRVYEANHESLHSSIASQVPFRRIREEILHSKATYSFADHFLEEAADDTPIYFGLMDDDCQALRTSRGLFSRFDTLIEDNESPAAISLGYNVRLEERPLIRLAVKIDMRVRAAMNSVVPFSAYLPEPASMFCIRRAGEESHYLKDLSFRGQGEKLESRRLWQNGLKTGIFNRTVAFKADGGVTTSTPARMKTKKNEKVQTLTPEVIKQKQYLQALRGLPQTHATPTQWADNLYVGLDFQYPIVTHVTTPMMHIFSVFDPISRMFDKELGRFSPKNTFDQIMDEYDQPLNETQADVLDEARDTLSDLGMEDEMIDHIEEAARRSGRAIYRELYSVAYLQ